MVNVWFGLVPKSWELSAAAEVGLWVTISQTAQRARTDRAADSLRKGAGLAELLTAGQGGSN
jgi:hypothetical protein